MAMKKQCETILQWQEDVQRVHDSHKVKFEETKQYIEKVSARSFACFSVWFCFSHQIAFPILTVADRKFKTQRDVGEDTAERETIGGAEEKEFTGG